MNTCPPMMANKMRMIVISTVLILGIGWFALSDTGRRVLFPEDYWRDKVARLEGHISFIQGEVTACSNDYWVLVRNRRALMTADVLRGATPADAGAGVSDEIEAALTVCKDFVAMRNKVSDELAVAKSELFALSPATAPTIANPVYQLDIKQSDQAVNWDEVELDDGGSD